MAYTKLKGPALRHEVLAVRDTLVVVRHEREPQPARRSPVRMFNTESAQVQALKRGARRAERYEGRAECRGWAEAA